MPSVSWDQVPDCLLPFVTHEHDNHKHGRLKWCFESCCITTSGLRHQASLVSTTREAGTEVASPPAVHLLASC